MATLFLLLFNKSLGDLTQVDLVSEREVEHIFQLAVDRAMRESLMFKELKSEGKDVLSDRSLIHSIHHLRRNLAKKLKRLKDLRDKGVKRIRDIRDHGLKHIKKTLGKHKEPKKVEKDPKKPKKGHDKKKKKDSGKKHKKGGGNANP